MKIRSAQSLVTVTAIAAIVALWALYAVVLETMRNVHLRDAMLDRENIIRVFEEGVVRDVQYVDGMLRMLRTEYEARGYDAFVSLLRRYRFDPSLVDHFALDDAAGNVRFITSGPLARPVNVSDRDYFAFQREGSGDELYIGAPVQGRATGKWLVRISHRLSNRDGSFAGIVKAAVDPYHLARLYDSVNLGRHGSVMLIGLDRILRSERGLSGETLGKDMSGDLPWERIDSSREGSFRAPSRVGSETRLYTYRVLQGVPLVLVVGVSERDIMERLLLPHMFLLMLAVFGTCAIAVLALLLMRQMRIQRQLTTSNHDLEQAYRTKSDFLSKMSHELRTPLNAILGFSEIMKGQTFGPVGNGKYLEYADAIHSSGEHLLSLINDILEMSKIEANKLTLEERFFDLRAAVRWAARLLQEQASSRGVSIHVEVGSAVGDVYGDERTIRQVLLNILGNALKFTGPGGRISITGSLDSKGDLSLAIADTGVGMSPDALEAALVPFGRGSNLKITREQGSGLGLPISKALMERHGGGLTLASERGKGTVVVLRFPAWRCRPRHTPDKIEPFAPPPAAASAA